MVLILLTNGLPAAEEQALAVLNSFVTLDNMLLVTGCRNTTGRLTFGYTSAACSRCTLFVHALKVFGLLFKCHLWCFIISHQECTTFVVVT